jgi:CrcB protein
MAAGERTNGSARLIPRFVFIQTRRNPCSSKEKDLDRYIMVMVGGGIGSLARYALGTMISARTGGRFPFGTTVINITGSFLIGVFMVLLTERFQPNSNWRLLLVVGFLGGYTTFSSFEFETYQAIRDGSHWIGVLNVLASVILGFGGVWLGTAIARR